jgi:hypothetical protein
MGTPVSDMMLGAPAGGQGGLTPEALELIRKLNPNGIQPPQEAQVPAPAPTPAPAAPAPGEQGFLAKFLEMIGLAPKTASLAPQGQPTPAPPTPEELARRNRILSGGQ